jgi:hypothetical protein
MTLYGCNHADDFLSYILFLYIVLMFKVFFLIQKNVVYLDHIAIYILCWMGNIMVVNTLKTMHSTILIYMNCLQMYGESQLENSHHQ